MSKSWAKDYFIECTMQRYLIKAVPGVFGQRD